MNTDLALPALAPRSIRLDVASPCQLKCPLCPTASGAIHRSIGTGFVRLADFEELLERNPSVRHVEISNYGEIFLNPDLEKILESAHRRGIELTADNGANFNRVPERVLEALVKYRFRLLRCSIDGATAATYAIYRKGGSLDAVLGNIRRLNELKALHGSELPELVWQFVAFGHNEHEIDSAENMARELGMRFEVKLNWSPDYSPVRDPEAIRRRVRGAEEPAGIDAIHPKLYASSICSQLWTSPQIHSDGRVLGCCVNFWGHYGNVHDQALGAIVNGPRMTAARDMLSGRIGPQRDVPCTTCGYYRTMRESEQFLRVDVNPDGTLRSPVGWVQVPEGRVQRWLRHAWGRVRWLVRRVRR